jgi:hypothetical protein
MENLEKFNPDDVLFLTKINESIKYFERIHIPLNCSKMIFTTSGCIFLPKLAISNELMPFCCLLEDIKEFLMRVDLKNNKYKDYRYAHYKINMLLNKTIPSIIFDCTSYKLNINCKCTSKQEMFWGKKTLVSSSDNCPNNPLEIRIDFLSFNKYDLLQAIEDSSNNRIQERTKTINKDNIFQQKYQQRIMNPKHIFCEMKEEDDVDTYMNNYLEYK